MYKNFEEEDFWKTKKVSDTKTKKLYRTTLKKTNSPFYVKKYGIHSYTSKSNQVLVKITGGSKNTDFLKRHINYISRNGALEIFTSASKTNFNGVDQRNQVFEFLKAGVLLSEPKENNNIKETYNIVFSFPNASGDEIKNASMSLLKKKFPDNPFIIAIHNDTDNPHCHIIIKRENYKTGKKLSFSPAELATLRKEFAKELNNLGISQAFDKEKTKRI